jgi:hypothetical protein
MITISTTSNGTLSWICHTCIAAGASLRCKNDSPLKDQSSVAFNWGDKRYNFTVY